MKSTAGRSVRGIIAVMATSKQTVIRKQWQGPGSLDQQLFALAFPTTYDNVIEEIYTRSGVRVHPASLHRWITQIRQPLAS